MGFSVKILLISAAFWVAGVSTAAADKPLNLPRSENKAPVAIDNGSLLLKTTLALAFTVFVIWVLSKVIKRSTSQKIKGGRGPAVEVLSRTALDKEMTVYVLRLGNQISVVSRSGSGSTLLRQISLQEAEEIGLLSSVSDQDQRAVTVAKELVARFRSQPARAVQVPQDVESLLADQDIDLHDAGSLLAAQPLTVQQMMEEEA